MFLTHNHDTAHETALKQRRGCFLLPTSPLWPHSSCLFMTSQMIGSQVRRQCGSTKMLMDNILSSSWPYVPSCFKKSTVCCCITCKLFPVSEVLIISITIMLFGYILVALGFLLSPITGLLKQPEQMFPSALLTKQASSGRY